MKVKHEEEEEEEEEEGTYINLVSFLFNCFEICFINEFTSIHIDFVKNLNLKHERCITFAISFRTKTR